MELKPNKMKLPKDRKMFPKLLLQFKAQEHRIKACGLDAYLNYYHPIQIETSSFYSLRFKK